MRRLTRAATAARPAAAEAARSTGAETVCSVGSGTAPGSQTACSPGAETVRLVDAGTAHSAGVEAVHGSAGGGRVIARLAVLTVGVAAALTLAAPPSSATTNGLDLLSAPADFATVMGYSPGVGWLADGTQRMINPTGACSVPGEGRPFDFAVACQAHDFGYDLLRYAERKGRPLPGQARTEIDHRLTEDLHTQCRASTSAATCDATVAVFAAAVGFNSWRQLSGPPVDRSGMTRTVGLSLLGLVGLGFAVRRPRRLRALLPPGSGR